MESPAWKQVLAPVAIIVIAAAVALWGTQPPRAKAIDAPESAFSGERAKAHSWEVAKEPHAAGTAEAEKVRDFIEATARSYGLETDIQRAPVIRGRTARYVENVIARIPGTNNKNPFVFTTHYDSVAWGPGAADDGSGVVVMLEVARALMAAPRLQNDIVFIFTSDEERGRWGAWHSMSHPWYAGTSAVLGFEARGLYGPAYMFETSHDYGVLLRELKASGAPVIGNSLMYEVHRKTPNTTDFTLMKEHGAVGYNVAFVGGLYYYHTMNDRPGLLRAASLQHQGEYAMALARHYGMREGQVMPAEDTIFFNTIGSHLVLYPLGWTRPITGLALGLALVSVLLGFARGRIRPAGLLMSMLLHVLAMALASGLAALITVALYKLFYIYMMYNANVYVLACMALALALVMLLQHLAPMRATMTERYAGALLLMTGAAAAFEVIAPRGSFMLAWPVIFAALGLMIVVLTPGRRIHPGTTLALAAVPAILLVVPGLYALHLMGAGLTLAVVTMLFVFLLALLSPALAGLARAAWRASWIVPAVAGLLLLGYGIATNGFTPDKPQQVCVSYALNLANGEAAWLSSDTETNSWTAQFFVEQRDLAHARGAKPSQHRDLLVGQAAAYDLAGPQLEVLGKTTAEGADTYTLRYTSPRKVAEAQVIVEQPTNIIDFTIESENVRSGYIDISVMPRSGIVPLTLTVPEGSTPVIRIDETSYGIPGAEDFAPRPDWMIPKPNVTNWWESGSIEGSVYSDYTFVSDMFTL